MLKHLISICAALTLTTGTAWAGFVLDQTVITSSGGKNATVELQWLVSDTGFRLNIRKGQDLRQFVYNGRVFYVCGKLDKGQQDLIAKLDLKDKELINRLQKGACQELSTDFTTRFFLLPHDAVSHIEIAEGFGSSLSFSGHEIALKGSLENVSGQKCVQFSRSYTAQIKGNKGSMQVNESSCNSAALKWRQPMSRDLGMALIRQPGGRDLFQTVTADIKKMPGMALILDATITGKNSQGVAIKRTVKVKSTRLDMQPPAAADLATPKGYEMLDTNALAIIAKESGPKSQVTRKEDVLDLLKFMILGGNPASALTVIQSEGGK